MSRSWNLRSKLGLNIIQIVSDTFRRDYLGCYGNNWIDTKCLDRFADKSLVFDRAYIASFPTIPHRRDIFTGRYTFTYSRWSPLPKDEIILSELLRRAGYTTMLITDTPHLVRNGYHYDRGFDGWWWIRGQEADRYMTNPTKDSIQRKKALGAQYLQSVSLRQFEEDYFAAQTMSKAVEWLELNYDQHGKFFLHVDTFDPHEPWDPPKWYADMYESGWKGGDVPGGAYITGSQRPFARDLTFDELDHLKALYAGEVTLVDRWVGRLLEKVDDLGLYEDTAVLFTSDHGTYIGEHGYLGKQNHLYEEVTHVPLMIKLPDSEGAVRGRCGSIVQSPDLMPTILDLAGVNLPPTIQAESLLPLARGEEVQKREIAVSSASLIRPWMSSRIAWITVTSEEWTLLAAAKDAPPKDMLARRIESELYHLPADPNQTQNLFYEEKEVSEEMRLRMVRFLKSIGTRDEFLSKWS